MDKACIFKKNPICVSQYISDMVENTLWNNVLTQ